jgi:hypothetical protein
LIGVHASGPPGGRSGPARYSVAAPSAISTPARRTDGIDANRSW